MKQAPYRFDKDASDETLRDLLLTLDGRGIDEKSQALDELLRRVTQSKFSIDQIRYYLDGCKLIRVDGSEVKESNSALGIALSLLEDEEDGIAATWERKLHYDKKATGQAGQEQED